LKRLKEEQKCEEQNKPLPVKKRARYPQFFEAEQLLDEQEAFHADTTVAAKLNLDRAGLVMFEQKKTEEISHN